MECGRQSGRRGASSACCFLSRLHFDLGYSRLMTELPGALAKDPAIDWPRARQAVLPAVTRTGLPGVR